MILRERVSKWVTNVSKTAVMDLVGFLYVSVSSNTVQLHDSLGNRRACTCLETGFNSQYGDRAWGVFYRRTAFCCAFLWANGRNIKDIHKEMFPVYGRKCILRKQVHNWARNSRRDFRRSQMMPDQVRKWLRRQSEDVYHCWWRVCREINVFFQVRISHVLHFISPCDLLTDSHLYVHSEMRNELQIIRSIHMKFSNYQ
jgi:hypothetical protein